MKYFRILALFCIFVVSTNRFSNEFTPQKGYSTKPLEKAVFEYAKVIVETTMFNNWLNSNFSKLTNDRIYAVREHLYYLIDSYVKAVYKRDKVILPKDHDLLLELLYSWSDKLGIYGGALVYSKIKNEEKPTVKAKMVPPSTFEITLENDLYLIKNTSGTWSVKIPYYFMIGDMKDFQATNGMQTQLVVISTGAAKDNSKLGHSQATLMLIYSPTQDYKTFSDYWRRQFAIAPETKTSDLPIQKFSSQKVYDKKSNLHKEIVFWSNPHGSYAIAYTGLDQTFQWNRIHFLDFLQNIKHRSKIAPAK